MAIDTAKKRYSMLGIMMPDRTIDQADRQTLLDLYGGILAGSGYLVRITALSVEPYIAQALGAVDLVAQAMTATDLVAQTLTWEDSEL